jgi:hypothetical protein
MAQHGVATARVASDTRLFQGFFLRDDGPEQALAIREHVEGDELKRPAPDATSRFL